MPEDAQLANISGVDDDRSRSKDEDSVDAKISDSDEDRVDARKDLA